MDLKVGGETQEGRGGWRVEKARMVEDGVRKEGEVDGEARENLGWEGEIKGKEMMGRNEGG